MKFSVKNVIVTVASGAVTGSSAADPTIGSNNSRIAGIFPTGVATSTGWGLVETVTLNANGSITITTRAAVATADLTVSVTVLTPANG